MVLDDLEISLSKDLLWKKYLESFSCIPWKALGFLFTK